jgi:hypothetical protein
MTSSCPCNAPWFAPFPKPLVLKAEAWTQVYNHASVRSFTAHKPARGDIVPAHLYS